MPSKIAYRIDEAAALIGIGRSRLYELIKAGEIELGKIHGRSVIRREVLEAHFAKHYKPQ